MSSCTIFNAHITDQVLQVSNLPRIASGSKDALQIRCNFCGKWDGCGKIAVFYRTEDEVYHVPVVDGLVTVPWEVLADEGYFWFGIMGQDDLTRTTEAIRIEVAKGALTVATATPQDPTPDIYEQLLSTYGLVEAQIQELVAMRSAGGEVVHTISSSDGKLVGTIKGNGTGAYIELELRNHAFSQMLPTYETSVSLPLALIPAGRVVLTPIDTADSDYVVHVSPTDDGARVAFRYWGDTESAPAGTSFYGHYSVAFPSLAELSDARVGVNSNGVSTNYDTAGQAIREQVWELHNRCSVMDDKIASIGKEAKIEGSGVEKTCIKFASLLYDTDKAESFIFFTDPHVCNPPNKDAENKMLTSFNILKTYYDATPTNFVLCGGDWLNDVAGQTNEDACYKLGRAAAWMRANFDRFYTAIGNHEDNYPFGASHEGADRYTVERGLSMETVRNLMLPDEKELYYSFDGTHTKFYVMNSSDVETDETMTDYRWGQVSWLAQRLKEDDAENSAIVMHSILLRPIGEGVFAHLAKNLLQLCEAYNNSTTIKLNGVTYDFNGCTGCVRFAMAGHIHDADCVETHYGIPVVLTKNMMASADRSEGYNPAFDLCLADYDKEVIRMVRVGPYGEDRDAPLASRAFKGNTYSVKKTLTEATASNPAVVVREGVSYSCELAANAGYRLSSVSVTMGGTNITSSAYSNGQITIANVTGDIVITATSVVSVYSVTRNLTNVTSSNTASTVQGGTRYETTLTAGSGNLAVSVMMGGVDITATAYNDGVVTIENVTGDVSITAKTVEYTNLVDLTSEDWSNTAKWDSNATYKFSNNGSGVITNFIPVKMHDNLRFYGFDTETKFNGQAPMIALYDENKNYLSSTGLHIDAESRGTSSGVPTDVVPDENGVVTYRVLTYGNGIHMTFGNQCYDARYVRINALPLVPVSELVVTVNEEIFSREKGNNLADPDSTEWYTASALDVSNKVMSVKYPNQMQYAMGTVTNIIPLVHGDVLRVKGFDWEASNNGTGSRLYLLEDIDGDGEHKSYVTYLDLRSRGYNTADGIPSTAIDENGVLTYHAFIRADNNLEYTYNNVSTRTKYVRISAVRNVPEDEIVITVNNPIE